MTSKERDLTEYLGKDRDELRGIIGERDAEIERLNKKLSAALQDLQEGRASHEPPAQASKKCFLRISAPEVPGGAWSLSMLLDDGSHRDLLYSQHPIEVVTSHEPSAGYPNDSLSKLIADMSTAAAAARTNQRDGVAAFVEQWIERLQSFAPPPEVIPDATRKLGELASAHILLRTALSQITVQRLRGRKTSAGLIAEDALDKTASAGHLAVALGTTGSNTDLDRYRQALYRANGFLIQHGIEPVKLEYNTPTKESSP